MRGRRWDGQGNGGFGLSATRQLLVMLTHPFYHFKSSTNFPFTSPIQYWIETQKPSWQIIQSRWDTLFNSNYPIKKDHRKDYKVTLIISLLNQGHTQAPLPSPQLSIPRRCWRPIEKLPLHWRVHPYRGYSDRHQDGPVSEIQKQVCKSHLRSLRRFVAGFMPGP